MITGRLEGHPGEDTDVYVETPQVVGSALTPHETPVTKIVPINDTPYTDEMLGDLDEIQSLRKVLTIALVGGNLKAPVVPKGTAEKIFLDQLINGREKQIHTVTKIKMSAKSKEGEREVQRAAIQAMLRDYQEPPRREVSDAELVIPERLKRPEFKPGALDVGMLPLTMADLGLIKE